MKAIHCFWRIWRALIVLSILEFALLVTAAGLDHRWSPCREHLDTCLSLHSDDCSGKSCRDGVPIWSSVWPLASLLFVALPLRKMLRYVTGFGATRPPRCLSLFLILALAV